MNTIHELQDKMYNDGLKVEDYFIELATRDGFKCLRATKYQDRNEHWDVQISKDNKIARIDVKGFKESHKTGFTWVELQAVDGKRGWVKGDAHVIAFEREDRFELIHRAKLLKLVESKILNPTGYVYIKPKDLSEIKYYRYKRMGRQDILVVIPFDDIKHLILKTIYK